jgi:DNA-binding transcriptional LysR family regulator
MTAAAKELHLTQSGVSQHVKAFEEVLGLVLFDRINQRVVPTSSAKYLYDHFKLGLSSIESAISEIRSDQKELTGRVTIGMPAEFGRNIVIPLITKFNQLNPKVSYEFELGFAEEMNVKLLNGQIDFAFVDEFSMDKRIKTLPIYDETLELCAHEDLFKVHGEPESIEDLAFYEKLDYVTYSKDHLILKRWFDHHLGHDEIQIKAPYMIAEAKSAGVFLTQKVAYGVLPGHLLLKLQKDGNPIRILKGSGKPLINTISIASVKSRSQNRATKVLMEFLHAQLLKG